MQRRLSLVGLLVLPIGLAALGYAYIAMGFDQGLVEKACPDLIPLSCFRHPLDTAPATWAVLGGLIGAWYAIVIARASFGRTSSFWELRIILPGAAFAVLAWMATFGEANAAPGAASALGQVALVILVAVGGRVLIGLIIRRPRTIQLPSLTRGTLIATWAGALIATPVLSVSLYSHVNATAYTPGAFASISCATRDWCVGADNSGNGPLLWLWQGRSWSRMPGGALPAGDDVFSVACFPTKRCVAVGNHTRFDGRVLPLGLEWQGSQWKVVYAPEEMTGVLASVACWQENHCVAVGDAPHGALTETWDGHNWTRVPNPLSDLHQRDRTEDYLLQQGGDALGSVVCPTATFCLAVGSMGAVRSPSQLQELVKAGDFGNALRHSVVALDSYTPAEVWNGTTWRALLIPTSRRALEQLACTSPRECLATEIGGSGPAFVSLESWNGRTWKQVWGTASCARPGYMVEECGNTPAVACTTNASCMAIFSPSNPSQQGMTVVFTAERFDGQRLSASASFRISEPFPIRTAAVTAQSCSSATSCVTEGAVSYGYCAHQAFWSSWNGKSWATETGPRFDC